MKLRLITALLGSATLFLAGPAPAAYPEKPITMIVAYAPGGGTDLMARVIAPLIEKHLGNNAKIAVVNRPGAGGEIGFTALADAAPDGYTIGMLNTPNLISIPIERQTRFSWDKYDLIGNLVDDPGGFAVHNDSPIKSLKELGEYAKANPNAVTVGSTGVGSDDHLAMLVFQKLTGTKMTHVPYGGSSQVRTGLLGRHITVASTNIGELSQFISSGAPFRVLGQMSQKRWEGAPDVPTFKEQGYDMEFASLRGMGAPKGLPADIREKLVDAVAKSVKEPEFATKAKEIFAPVRYLPPDQYAAEMKKADEDLRQLWKEMPWGK